MTPTGWFFTLATLLPVPLLVAAAFWGGVWGGAAILYLTLLTFALDELGPVAADRSAPGHEFPLADRLSSVLAVGHFFLLGLAVWALSGGAALSVAGTVVVFLAYGLFFGQVSNPNAHELIHRADRRLFLLGKWVYISLLFGHHTSAHRLVHHRFAASADDPNSAPLGQSFYRFAPRAWLGSFAAGYRGERAMQQRKNVPHPRLSHPYNGYVLGAGATLIVAWLIGGWGGVVVLVLLAGYAQVQLLLSDYVQHYGLRRRPAPDGRPEAITLHHSWNAPQWFSNYLMLAAPRHSDHHAHPARPYPQLVLPAADQAPSLPHSLPVMALIALFPPRWRRVMDQRARCWQRRNEARPQGLTDVA